jgi:acyl carrier protein
MSDIAREVIDMIADILRAEPQHITPQARLVHDLGADSLDSVALVLALEDRFRIDMPDEDVEQLRTVQQLIEYVELAVAIRQPALRPVTLLQEQLHDSTSHRDHRS